MLQKGLISCLAILVSLAIVNKTNDEIILRGNLVPASDKYTFEDYQGVADETLNNPITPTGISINSIKFGGTGCASQKSTTAEYSEKFNMISLKFEEFVVSTGPGARASDSRKQCQIIIDMRYPRGWSYSFGSVQYRGNLNLPAGNSARQKATYFFAGATGKETTLQTIYNGPKDNEEYGIDDYFPNNKIWSDCNFVQPAVIKASIELAGNMNIYSNASVSRIEKHVTQEYGVEWREC